MVIGRLVLLLGFFAAFTPAWPQVEWVNVYNEQPSTIYSITKAIEGGWMFCGAKQDTSIKTPQWIGAVGFITSNGKLRWDKEMDKHSDCFDVIRTKRGYLVAGQNDTGLTNKSDGFLWLLDEQGNLQWGHDYGGSSYEEIWKVIEANNGDFLFAGISYSSDGDIKHNSGYSDCWLGRARPDGSLLWDTTLGGPGPDGGGYVAELADHTLALAFNLGSPDLVHRSNDDLFLVHLDSIGNVISQKQFGTSANDDPLAIKASGDGNIIIASLWKYSRSWAVKTTTDGNIIWQTDSNGLPYDPTAALIGPDNSIYFGGFDSMQVKDTIPSLRDTFTMWIVKVDGNGHTVWRHHYRFTDSANIMISHPQPQQLALDDDGGLIIAGNGRINGVSHGFIKARTGVQ